jgi:hypothetical protein
MTAFSSLSLPLIQVDFFKNDFVVSCAAFEDTPDENYELPSSSSGGVGSNAEKFKKGSDWVDSLGNSHSRLHVYSLPVNLTNDSKPKPSEEASAPRCVCGQGPTLYTQPPTYLIFHLTS